MVLLFDTKYFQDMDSCFTYSPLARWKHQCTVNAFVKLDCPRLSSFGVAYCDSRIVNPACCRCRCLVSAWIRCRRPIISSRSRKASLIGTRILSRTATGVARLIRRLSRREKKQVHPASTKSADGDVGSLAGSPDKAVFILQVWLKLCHLIFRF